MGKHETKETKCFIKKKYNIIFKNSKALKV